MWRRCSTRRGRYSYWRGFNLIAVAWTAIGSLICGFVLPMAWLPALQTLLIVGLGYWLTAKLMPPSWSGLG
jgi:hypothetical protein